LRVSTHASWRSPEAHLQFGLPHFTPTFASEPTMKGWSCAIFLSRASRRLASVPNDACLIAILSLLTWKYNYSQDFVKHINVATKEKIKSRFLAQNSATNG